LREDVDVEGYYGDFGEGEDEDVEDFVGVEELRPALARMPGQIWRSDS
jgi:hypothetical protein